MIGNKSQFIISYKTPEGENIVLGVVEAWELARWVKYLTYRIEKGTCVSYTVKEA